MSRAWLSWIVVMLTLTGCLLPGTRVTKNPAGHDRGIRYYRPKPYLLLTPLREPKDTEGSYRDEFVTVSLQYLPDFSEEYSLHITPGFGRANVNVTLDQGWNLTKISQDLDSQFDENLKAMGDLASHFVPTARDGKRDSSGTEKAPTFVVRATNVPIGYYESVIGIGPNGAKQLFGWRYVGFAPFNACPTQLLGGQTVCCDDPAGAIYGLVFEHGVMVFRPLNQIPHLADTTRGTPPALAAPSAEVLPTGHSLDTLSIEALRIEAERQIHQNPQIRQHLGRGFTAFVNINDQKKVVVLLRDPSNNPLTGTRAEPLIRQLPGIRAILNESGGDAADILFQ